LIQGPTVRANLRDVECGWYFHQLNNASGTSPARNGRALMDLSSRRPTGVKGVKQAQDIKTQTTTADNGFKASLFDPMYRDCGGLHIFYPVVEEYTGRVVSTDWSVRRKAQQFRYH
jgi:hypothetical protein